MTAGVKNGEMGASGRGSIDLLQRRPRSNRMMSTRRISPKRPLG
jgi:hypothetical protein